MYKFIEIQLETSSLFNLYFYLFHKSLTKHHEISLPSKFKPLADPNYQERRKLEFLSGSLIQKITFHYNC